MKVENVSYEQTFVIDQIVTRYLHQLIADLVTHRLIQSLRHMSHYFCSELKHIIIEEGFEQVTILKLVFYVMRAPDTQAM